tara:strand:+ start:2753 stop:3487 length:735 start_codon:yes stop_codon:yes gene_type:complete
MAIALGAALGATTSLSASTLSINNLTVSGSDRVLIVGATCGLWNSATTITSVTYGGTGLTQLGGNIVYSGDGLKYSLWYLIAPSTTANQTLTINLSAATYVGVGAVYYTGVDQTTPLTSLVTTSDASSPASITNTSDLDGSWQVGLISGSNGSISISSGGTSRQVLWSGFTLMEDSNSTVANGATNTITWTYSGGGGGGAAMLRPVAAASSQIKSADGVVLANIKSWDGVAIASVKSASGVANS